MRRIMTGAAAIALMAAAAQAQDNGRGNATGGGNGGDHPAHGATQGRGDGGKGHNNGQSAAGEAVRAPDRGRGGKDRGGARAERDNPVERAKGGARALTDDRGPGNAERLRDNASRAVAIDNRGRDDVRRDLRVRDFAASPARGLVTGCPPGLAKKNPPCVPPGQARSAFRAFDRPDFWGLRLGEGDYRYDDGYLVRLAPTGRVGGYIPLLGGALAVGNPWPASYEPVALPAYYENYYRLGGQDSYRYADNVIYQIDPETAAITSIAALLTGDRFVVGQAMPAGYDVYNVPYSHRAQYRDTPDAAYRYSDGYLYQVDPETRLIAAAIELLAS